MFKLYFVTVRKQENVQYCKKKCKILSLAPLKQYLLEDYF